MRQSLSCPADTPPATGQLGILLAGSLLLHGLLGLALWPAKPLAAARPADASVDLLFEAMTPPARASRAPLPILVPRQEPQAVAAAPPPPLATPPYARAAPRPDRPAGHVASHRRAASSAVSPAPSRLASTPSPVTSPELQKMETTWRQDVSDWMQSHKVYPEAARRHGDQGTALVRTRVGRDGSVLAFVLLQQTGSPRLDAAVVKLMQNARVPAFPASMQQSEATLSVTLNYRLSD